jgi:hypothetical protein
MTQDEIIEMAREIATTLGSRMCDENGDTHGEELYCMGFDDIVDAVKLVADVATAKEREACVEICDRFQARDVGMQPAECAGAIRARGETTLRGEE